MKSLILSLSVLLLTIPVLAQQRIYVDASKSSSGNGQSWATAYNNLSDALNNAAEGAEIWVAEGVYVPEGPARLCQFTIDKNVSLYGGFRGDEEFIWERGDYRDYPTILSGDIEGNDEPGDFNNNKDDNCRHVIFITEDIDNSTVIDGFFIQGGHTDGLAASDDNRRGGGILSYGAPIISNCNFNNNYAYLGAALYPIQSGSSGTQIIQSDFINNQAYRGAAIFTVNSNISIHSSYFFKNNSLDLGSVLFALSSDWIMYNCLIVENTSPVTLTTLAAGSTIASFQTGTLENESHLINNTFVDNIGFYDGVSNVFGSDATNHARLDLYLKNNIFSNTDSMDIGTAVYPGGAGGSNILSQGGNLSINDPPHLNHSTDQINVSDPIFVNPKTRDFSLIPGSPAIGAGVGGMNVPFDDIRGTLRLFSLSSGCYEILENCSYMPASCICFDYTLIDNQLSASMPCGDDVRWYINDQLGGSAGSQFDIDLSSGFGNEVTFCIKQNTSDSDYRCCVTIYLEEIDTCDDLSIPNAHYIIERHIDSIDVNFKGESSENYCSQNWNGQYLLDHLTSFECNYFNKNDLNFIDFGNQVPPYVYHYPRCFTVSNRVGYSRYCADNFTFGSDFPKVNPTFDWDELTLTIEMDDDFPSFPIGSAVFLDPGDGSGLSELEDFIAEGSFEYEFESSGTYLVKLYVNHPTLANYTISWSIVPIPASCDGGEISLRSDLLSEEECYTSNLLIRNRQSASCSDCGSGNPSPAYEWEMSIGNPYNWNEIDGAVNASFTISQNPTETIFYRRKVTFSWMESGQMQNCEVYSNRVRVNPRPSVSASNTGPYCVGATIELFGSSGASYSWMGPSGFSSSVQNPTRLISTTNMGGIYTVSVTDSNGCSSTATTNVVVNPNPSVSASNTGPYCEGATIELFGSSGASYSWMGPSGFSSSIQNPTRQNATTNMGGTYTVSVTDSNGCSSTATTNVVVNPNPIVTASNSGPYCEGATIELFGSSGASYSWMGPSGFSSSIQNPTRQNATTNMGGTYTVSVTNSNGCLSTATTVVEVKERPPAPMLSVDCSQGINNGKIIIISPLGEDFRYSLNGEDFQDSPEFSGLSNNSYTVIVESRNTGCRSSSAITVNCCNNPPTLLLNGSSIAVCGLEKVEVEDNIFGGSASQVSIAHNGNGTLTPTNSNTSPFAFKYNPGQDDLGKTVVITVVTDNPVDSSCVEVESRFEIIFYKSDREVSPPDKPCPNRFYPPFWDLDDILFTSDNILILDEGFILLENVEAEILIEFEEEFLNGALICDFSKEITITPASTPDLGESKPTIWTSVFVQNETDTLILYEIQWLPDGELNLQWGALKHDDEGFMDVYFEEQSPFFIRDSREAGVVFCDIGSNGENDCPLRIYAQPLTEELLAELRSTSEEERVPEKPDLLLYPNPGSQQLNIALSSTPAAQMKLTVWDSRGKLVHSERVAVTAGSGDFLHTLSTEAWPPGLYLVRITGIDGEVFMMDEKWIKF